MFGASRMDVADNRQCLAAGFIDAQLAKKLLSGIPATIVGGIIGAIKASAPKD